MEIFGLTIARTSSLQLETKRAGAWSTVSGSRGWWPIIKEVITGGWQRNCDVQADIALSNPTLYACITLIAGDIAKLRPMLVEQDDDGVWSEIESPAFSPVLRKPNHYQTRIDFFEWWMLSKLCHGNAYALKARDGRGVVQALYILDPFRVQALVAPDGSVFYQLDADELSRVGEAVAVPSREIIHDTMCPLFHPLVGVSPIYAAGFPALQGLNIRHTSDQFFRSGSKPGGVLTAPGMISQDTAQRMKEYWEAEFSGNNVGRIAVLGDGLKYEAMAVSAEQSQLVEQLKMTDEDIAKCFHMPRHKVGIGDYPTYTNIEALNQQYYSDCLQKHIEKLETVLDYGLELVTVPGRTIGVEFDLDDLLKMDSKTLVDVEKNAGGLKTVNESRRRLGLSRVEGGDTIFRQQQDYSLEALNRRDSQAQLPPAESFTSEERTAALEAYLKAVA